ncbi:ShET2/EspL2 family type III secretion system effector toxin, partial [Caballeronia calidae]|uniref:ShET2/EspL2 family type III secretion system effector toxin n=1 Tax=Caballeronia calidae TaxID=1777139 RepID=UPI000AE70A1C
MIVNSLTPKSGNDCSNELNQSPRKGPVPSKSASPLVESLKPRGTKDFYFKKFDEVGIKTNNNGKYKFPGTDEKLWCRNLSLTFKLDSDKERKVDTAKRFNKSALQEGVNFCTDEDWHNYTSKANSDIILMSEFGAWIVFQLDKLGEQPSQSNGRKWRSAMISTGQHVMALTLEIKPESSDMKRYVVRFYDPAITEEYTRFASNNLNDLKKAHFFDAFPNHRSLAKSYDPHMMRLIEMITDPTSDARFSGKRPINYESAEPRFFLAMSSGVLQEIEQLSSDAKAGSLSKEALKSLFVKFPNNIDALHKALLSGNEAVILAYLKLATQADVDLKPLLMNVGGLGTFALCKALEISAFSHMPSQARKQSEKALQTYMEFLRMVGITDYTDIKKLLLNNTVLQSVLTGGSPSTALNYVETLKKIGADSTDIKKLLLTKSGKGKTTFHRVMDHSPPPISAYLTMLAA